MIQVPENWRGGLVVFAHGIQHGPGRGDLGMLPIAGHVLAEGPRGSHPAIARVNTAGRSSTAEDERGVRPDGEDVLATDLSRIGLK
jgi:hypothetical protein